jgi:hypothetical protein
LFGNLDDSEPETEETWEVVGTPVGEAAVTEPSPSNVSGSAAAPVSPPRTQAGARATAANTSYRRLRRVSDTGAASSGASGSSSAPAFRPLPWEVSGVPASLHEGRHLARGVVDRPSCAAAAPSDAVPVNRVAEAHAPKAKAVPRRVAGQNRYYAISSVSQGAREKSILRPGIYCSSQNAVYSAVVYPCRGSAASTWRWPIWCHL